MRSGARYRLWVGAIFVATLAGGCGGAQTPKTDADADAVAKQAWMQPISPELADQLRHRLITGQEDH
ncbi:MAG TPA: hypothetical protein VFU39_05795 [Sulfuricaulis sp.]|nr:hypothetical protein [Gammaproteobacteria bacterium]MDH3407707.1 hypothetical protein [Gammaproteobacteria bacterium]MDH5487773.1 hypothetical protein [Gammaproteobacteria bacterium]HEU5338782.1 hypothetical protein [Sulfuricaulis sp.]